MHQTRRDPPYSQLIVNNPKISPCSGIKRRKANLGVASQWYIKPSINYLHFQSKTLLHLLTMHLTKTLALLAMSTGALSFKIRAFTGPDCTGDAKEINIYDNTCRDRNTIPTKSFRVLAYGARRQRAAFYAEPKCVGGQQWTDYWADGGSDTFKKGRCLTLDFKANAFGSRSA